MRETKDNSRGQVGKWAKFALMLFAVLQITMVYIQPLPAHAAINSFALDQICAPDQDAVGSGLNLQRCVNNIYIFSIIIGGFVAVMLFVFAGYLYTFGTADSVKQAKSIMGSTLAGLILLFIAYAFLNTIGGKSLTTLDHLNTLPEIHCPKGVDCSLDPKIGLPGTDTIQNAANMPPDGVLNAGCQFNGIASTDTKFLVQEMYNDLLKVCNGASSKVGPIYITSIYSPGQHAQNSFHYKGCAVDFAGNDPDFINSAKGQAILTAAKALGFAQGRDSLTDKYRINPGTDEDKTNHIHLDLGAACPSSDGAGRSW